MDLSLIRTFPNDEVICLGCGAVSELIGNRYEDFMKPHFEGVCGAGYETIYELFKWEEINQKESPGND